MSFYCTDKDTSANEVSALIEDRVSNSVGKFADRAKTDKETCNFSYVNRLLLLFFIISFGFLCCVFLK